MLKHAFRSVTISPLDLRTLSRSARSCSSRWRSYWEEQRCSMVRSSTDAWLSNHCSGSPLEGAGPPFLSYSSGEKEIGEMKSGFTPEGRFLCSWVTCWSCGHRQDGSQDLRKTPADPRLSFLRPTFLLFCLH